MGPGAMLPVGSKETAPGNGIKGRSHSEVGLYLTNKYDFCMKIVVMRKQLQSAGMPFYGRPME